MTTAAANPLLEGNFAPIRQETTTTQLQVIGELPSDLRGMFVRNGPNPQFPPVGQYHWFDGDGMLHGVRIQDGVSYSNRYIRTRGFQIEQQSGKAVWTGLMEPPQMDNPYGPSKNTANTALVWHADKFLALWEGGEPHQISLPELSTVGSYTYAGKLGSAFTAHPKVDPVTGEMMFFGYSISQPPYLQYSVVSAQGNLLKTVPIDLPVGVVMHDFAITEHYTIFMDLPLTFRPERMQRGEPPLMFERERPSRFGIMPRHGDNSSIRWFEASPCYVFHTLNAYEEGQEVVLVACHMSSTGVFGGEQYPAVRRQGLRSLRQSDPEGDTPRLYQWRFNLETGQVREAMLDNTPSEFPQLHQGKLGRKIRYGYTAKASSDPLPRFEGIIKYDFEGGTQTHYYGEGRYGGEAVFVARSNASAEDDGWLVGLVHDENTNTSELLVINAQEMQAEPVARVVMPQRVPYGFHGTWVSEEQLMKTQ